ncbi:MAG: LptF/LptG family permease, partial [Phycisphaerae bacterium]
YDAPQATLGARASPDGKTLLEFKLEERGGERVIETHIRPGHADDARDKRDVFVDRLLMPDAVVQRMAGISPSDVLAAEPTPEMDPLLEDDRASVRKSAKLLLRRVDSTIHFRLGYGASPIFTVIIGAILGFMFRGSRALAAFGLAAIPFFSSLVVMLMGRQLMENSSTASVGVYVIWGSLLAFGAAAIVLLRVGVRR